jgi:thiol-disulfide isomerase/thioredoxin
LLARKFFHKTGLWLLLALTVAPGAYPAEPALLNLAPHRGKVVVVDFWASWCVPCRRSIPWLNAMREKYAKDGLEVIGVNVDADRSEAVSFLAQTPANFQIVYDTEGRLPKEYGVVGMPSSFVFDREGRLVAKHIGFQNAKRDGYEKTLRELLTKVSE